MPGVARAAGGVVYRSSGDGLEVCLVHRERYDDWSLPKGTMERGEHPLAAAVREVTEETGLHVVPLLRMSDVHYTLPDGRPKVVEFWVMRSDDDELAPIDTREVDQAVWLPAASAASRASYDDDRRLLTAFAALPPITSVSGLVRHAHAGVRKKWQGEDALRPIDDEGIRQAEAVSALYQVFRPRRLYAATPLRCKQTLEPLARDLGGLPIVLDSAFAEPPEAADAPAKAKLAAQRLIELRAAETPVFCSQGKVIPHLLAALRDETDPAPYKTRKGGGWVLTWSGDRLLGLTRL
jgi:8-oxo-dGTP diphosphatase